MKYKKAGAFISMMTMQAGFYTILLIIFLKYDVVISIADKYDNGIIEREDLNVFFQPRTPWLGGDVALSIPLLNHNFLWVWGDTLVGNITPNGHRNIPESRSCQNDRNGS